jgi:hypothetical protein
MNTYTCYYEDCQKRYNSKYNLIRHINSYHLDNKSYMCSFCSKGFYNKQSLDSHLASGLCGNPKKGPTRGLMFDLSNITEIVKLTLMAPPAILLPALPRIEKDRQVPLEIARLPITSFLFEKGRILNQSLFQEIV